MYYIREHDLSARKTVLLAQIADYDEATEFCRARAKKLKEQNPPKSMLSMDINPDQVYDYDDLINMIVNCKDEVEELAKETGKENITVKVSMGGYKDSKMEVI